MECVCACIYECLMTLSGYSKISRCGKLETRFALCRHPDFNVTDHVSSIYAAHFQQYKVVCVLNIVCELITKGMTK